MRFIAISNYLRVLEIVEINTRDTLRYPSVSEYQEQSELGGCAQSD